MNATYEFTIKGKTSLLMHAANVEMGDAINRWYKDPANKSISVAGDDRSPDWKWMIYLHHDGQHVGISTTLIMAALRSAGAKITLKGKTTYKSASQSGIAIMDEYFPIVTPVGPIKMADITRLRVAGEQAAIAVRDTIKTKAEKEDYFLAAFSPHLEAARRLGFELDVCRAKIGQSSHVRVRPKFAHWTIKGTLIVTDPVITPAVLGQMFEIAGSKCGLGDWRPNSKSPGPHGQFTTELKQISVVS